MKILSIYMTFFLLILSNCAGKTDANKLNFKIYVDASYFPPGITVDGGISARIHFSRKNDSTGFAIDTGDLSNLSNLSECSGDELEIKKGTCTYSSKDKKNGEYLIYWKMEGKSFSNERSQCLSIKVSGEDVKDICLNGLYIMKNPDGGMMAKQEVRDHCDAVVANDCSSSPLAQFIDGSGPEDPPSEEEVEFFPALTTVCATSDTQLKSGNYYLKTGADCPYGSYDIVQDSIEVISPSTDGFVNLKNGATSIVKSHQLKPYEVNPTGWVQSFTNPKLYNKYIRAYDKGGNFRTMIATYTEITNGALGANREIQLLKFNELNVLIRIDRFQYEYLPLKNLVIFRGAYEKDYPSPTDYVDPPVYVAWYQWLKDDSLILTHERTHYEVYSATTYTCIGIVSPNGQTFTSWSINAADSIVFPDYNSEIPDGLSILQWERGSDNNFYATLFGVMPHYSKQFVDWGSAFQDVEKPNLKNGFHILENPKGNNPNTMKPTWPYYSDRCWDGSNDIECSF